MLAHVLHQLLDGCVQRKDYDIIRDLLPPKVSKRILLIRITQFANILIYFVA